MTVEERLNMIESNLNALINMVSKLRLNTEADVNGARQSISEITPFTMTKSAYYGENAKAFYGVPEGNTSVFFSKYNGSYTTSRVGSTLTVAFDTLTEPTDITISIN
jgi:hypothetical protein